MISSAIQELIKPQVPEFDVDALRKVLISAVGTNKEKTQTQPGKATVSFVEATGPSPGTIPTPTATVLRPKPPPISAPPQGITLQSILDRAKCSWEAPVALEGRYSDEHNYTIHPNAHICGLVARQASAAVSALSATPHNEPSGRTDLDSHANMVVLGRDCFILSQKGLQADVNAFTPDHQSLPIPIVNGAKLYIDPYTGTKWIIVFKHALTVPTMENDLVPPFLLREAGIEVNETAKIHMKSPSVTDHSIYFPSSELRIPLSLYGMFSYFPSYKPTIKDLKEIDEDHILLATPDGSWNPHSDVYAMNEENLLDWDGNIVPPKDQVRIMLDDLPDDSVMAASVTISSVERSIVDRRFQPLPSSNEHSTRQPFSDLTNREGLPKLVPPEIDEVYAHLKKVSPTLVPEVFEAKLTRQQEVGHFYSQKSKKISHASKSVLLTLTTPSKLQLHLLPRNCDRKLR
jgi:hypothetical protein